MKKLINRKRLKKDSKNLKSIKNKEKPRKLEYEKDVILKNIENFYQDRIAIIKAIHKKRTENQKNKGLQLEKYTSSIIKEQKK